MKLAAWFKQRNADGSRRLKGEFARRIGKTPSMVSEYCADTAWPGKETMEAIFRETNGAVTPNDFVQLETVAAAE